MHPICKHTIFSAAVNRPILVACTTISLFAISCSVCALLIISVDVPTKSPQNHVPFYLLHIVVGLLLIFCAEIKYDFGFICEMGSKARLLATGEQTPSTAVCNSLWFFPFYRCTKPSLALIWLYVVLVELMWRALDDKIASLKLRLDLLWELMHLIQPENFRSCVVWVVIDGNEAYSGILNFCMQARFSAGPSAILLNHIFFSWALWSSTNSRDAEKVTVTLIVWWLCGLSI